MPVLSGTIESGTIILHTVRVGEINQRRSTGVPAVLLFFCVNVFKSIINLGIYPVL